MGQCPQLGLRRWLKLAAGASTGSAPMASMFLLSSPFAMVLREPAMTPTLKNVSNRQQSHMFSGRKRLELDLGLRRLNARLLEIYVFGLRPFVMTRQDLSSWPGKVFGERRPNENQLEIGGPTHNKQANPHVYSKFLMSLRKISVIAIVSV